MAFSSRGGDSSIFDPLFELSALQSPVAVLLHSNGGGAHSNSSGGGGNDARSRRQFARDVSAVANTRVDWLETAAAHVFKADLPGLSKEEIKITVEDDGRTLQIAGERKEEAAEGHKYHRMERVRGCFLRRFRLPQEVNLNAVRAEVVNGVLTVTVPKAEKPKPHVRSIPVQ